MSCTSPFTVASTIVPLPSPSVFSMCGSRCATAAFITSADCEHERQLHLAGAEQLADGLHARQQRVVDDLQCGPGLQRRVEVGVEAGRSPSTIRRSSRSNSGSAASSSARPAFADDAETPSNSSMNRLSGS